LERRFGPEDVFRPIVQELAETQALPLRAKSSFRSYKSDSPACAANHRLLNRAVDCVGERSRISTSRPCSHSDNVLAQRRRSVAQLVSLRCHHMARFLFVVYRDAATAVRSFSPLCFLLDRVGIRIDENRIVVNSWCCELAPLSILL
jgi:hypothetical protein